MVIGFSVLGWPTAPFRWEMRRDVGMVSGALGDQVGMLAQPVAGSLDLDEDSM